MTLGLAPEVTVSPAGCLHGSVGETRGPGEPHLGWDHRQGVMMNVYGFRPLRSEAIGYTEIDKEDSIP